jgi:hypothetical protein
MQDDDTAQEEANILADYVANVLDDYLELHEGDIAIGMNDFGSLKPVFIAMCGREPEKPKITL